MIRVLWALCVTTLLSGTTTPWRASLRRIGPVRMGMTVREAQAAVGTGQVPAFDSTAECDYVEIPGAPSGVSFMVSHGRVVRYDVDEPGVKTASGAEVGMPSASVLRLYSGKVRTRVSEYGGAEAPDLVYEPSPGDSAFGLIFETNGRVVIRFRGGRRSHVGLIEGCS